MKDKVRISYIRMGYDYPGTGTDKFGYGHDAAFGTSGSGGVVITLRRSSIYTFSSMRVTR